MQKSRNARGARSFETPPPVLRFRTPATLDGGRLDAVIAGNEAARTQGITRKEAALLAQHGAVKVNGRPERFASRRMREGEPVEVTLPRMRTKRDPEPLGREVAVEVPILYRGDGFVVVDKPAGLPTEATRDPARPTVVSVLRAALGAPGSTPFAVPHRLDRDTSGALVVCHRPDILSALNESLKARLWRKLYVAVVHGVVAHDEMRLESFLACIGSRGSVERFGSVRSGGKKAVTLCHVRERRAHTSVVECLLETGRTHQARVHMAEAGHPLVGDELYGAPAGEHARVGRHLLHAHRLELPDPVTGERITIESKLPDLFERDFA